MTTRAMMSHGCMGSLLFEQIVGKLDPARGEPMDSAAFAPLEGKRGQAAVAEFTIAGMVPFGRYRADIIEGA